MTEAESLRQEAIQIIDGDYLATLRRLVADGRKRNDPTLAIGLSIEALGLLVAEVDALRLAVSSTAWNRDAVHPKVRP